MSYKSFTLVLFFLTSFSCIYAQDGKDSLIVFVGEKIEILLSPPKTEPIDSAIIGTKWEKLIWTSPDNRYLAKYKILEQVHGKTSSDTIEFIVYDHYGKPAFSKYDKVMLFLSYEDGELYHEKYQYFDLYLTKNGRWASPYSSEDYNHPYKDSITVMPEIILFKDTVSFPTSNLTEEQKNIWFPEPFYRRIDGKAIAIYGNYLRDLFILKQQTVLKARGIF